jgi:hypothetical protein
MSNQGGWRWCQKCEGLYFAGNVVLHGALPLPDEGSCPAGGSHDDSASGKYVMQLGEGSANANPQGGWRWCQKCQGLFFSGNADQGNCPAGGKHDNSRSGPYVMPIDQDLPGSVTLHSGPITTDLSLGGFADLFMGSGGDFTFSGHMHDSGALGIDFLVTFVALTPSGLAFSAQHGDHSAGTFTPGDRNANWTIPGFNDQIKNNWPELSQANLTFTVHANDTLTPQIGAALEEAVSQAIQAAGKAAVTGLISLL